MAKKIPKEKVMTLINAKRGTGMTDDQIFKEFLGRKDTLGKNMNTLVNRYSVSVSDPKKEAAAYFGLNISSNTPKKKAEEPKGLIGRSIDKISAAASQIGSNQIGNGGVANVGGVLDAAVSVGGGLADMSLDGFAKLGGGFGSLARGGGFLEGADQGTKNYESSIVSDGLKSVATPRTQTGEKMLDVLGIADDAIVAAGDATYDATGSPLAGTTVVTGLNALGFLLGGRGSKSKANSRSTPPTIITPEPLRLTYQPEPVPRPQLTPEQVRTRVAEVRTARQQANGAPPPVDIPTLQSPTNPTSRTTGSIDDVAARLDNLGGRAEPPIIDTGAPINTPPVQPPPTITPPVKAAPIERLLNLDESKPKVGGVDIEVQGTRAEVLRDIGIPDDSVRKGSITGDITQLETEKTLSKLETAEGLSMREKMGNEFDIMNNYANNIIEDGIGARAGASPESRGQVVIDALQSYKDWYREQVKADYAKADAAMEGKGGIKLSELESEMNRNSSWQGKQSNQTLRKGIRSYLKEMDLIDVKAGEIKPMTAKQAEGLRQYINSQWSPDSASIIARVNESIDTGVFKALDDNAYIAARKRYRDYKETFENPKGIGKLLDVDGINRAVSAEAVGKSIQQLAVKDGAQFKHIYDLLDNLPENLKPQGARAKAEIQAAIAEIILNKKGLKTTNSEWMQYRRTNDDGTYKAQAIFGEEVAKQLDTYIAGRNVLQHHDPNPSGTATTGRNIDSWNSPDNIAGAGVGVAGGVLSGGGALATVVGGLAGKAIVGKVRSAMINKQMKADYATSINPERAKVYREANDMLVNDVIDSAEFREMIDVFENPKPNETKLKVLQRKLMKTDQWKAYVKSLPAKSRRAAMSSADVLVMLTQGANSQDDELLKPTF